MSIWVHVCWASWSCLSFIQMSTYGTPFRGWNALPESVISSVEIADESVAKFITLVRARD